MNRNCQHDNRNCFCIAVLVVGFSEPDYRQPEEPNAQMEVMIDKDPPALANPVTLRIIPLTVNEALARGIVTDLSLFPDDNAFSPVRAGE